MLINPSITYAGKIYATAGLTPEDAAWIGPRVDLLVTDNSGDNIAADIKTANPAILLMRYIVSCVVSTGETFEAAVPEGDIPTEHPDWIWMWNPNGEPEKIWMNPARYYILPNSGGETGWAADWVQKVLDYIGALPFDGVHGDVAVQSLLQFKVEQEKLWQYYELNYPEDPDGAFRNDQESYIAALRAGLNSAGLLAGFNNFGINNPYFVAYRLPNIDWLNHQYIFVTLLNDQPAYQAANVVETLMDIIDVCKAAGKICMLATGIGEPPWDLDFLKYCVHCHMLVSQHPYTYLNLDPAQGGSWAHLQTLFNDYAEAFQTDFGEPTGERYKEEGIWKRQFTNGLLEIDLVNHTYSFAWGKPQPPTILGSGEGAGTSGRDIIPAGAPETNLKELVEDYYGSAHYLFMVLNQNGLSVPTIETYDAVDLRAPVNLMRCSTPELMGGQVITLPPRGSRKRVAEAERRRKQSTYVPV